MRYLKIIFFIIVFLFTLFFSNCNLNDGNDNNDPDKQKPSFSIKVILSPELEYGHYVITDLDELNSFKEESNLLLDEYTSKF
ncbi:MAG TPA: hypothetical protein GX692_08670, partial [Acholeplasmataceae bacterium]|nr:hypothetical protein [Acholeplasmataceae bacterium]